MNVIFKTTLMPFTLAIVFTWFMRRLALRFNFVDMPGERKIHQRPMPLLGGWAVYPAFALSLPVMGLLRFDAVSHLLVSGGLLLLIGTLDEQGLLHPQMKLMAAMPAVGLIMAAAGNNFNIFNNLFADSLLTVFWFTGFMASFEIIDHIDGLNSGLAFIAATFFAIHFFYNGRHELALLSVLYMGSVLGFLMFNFHPARIFLGDGGAMFNGLVMAFLSVKLHQEGAPAVAKIAVPLSILIVPFLDTSLCLISRSKRGLIPFACPGKDHIAHRIMSLGLGQRGAAFILYGIAALGGAFSLFLSGLSQNGLFIFIGFFLLAFAAFISYMEGIAFEKQTRSEFMTRI